jgi:iron complex outermembrane recepter protein
VARRRAMLLSASAVCALGAGPAYAQPATDNGIEAITVTATRRAEALQDVPISIQALSGEQLQQLNIENFDDLINFTPNVTETGFGPGQVSIYMRGLSVGGDNGSQAGGSVGSFPNVAVYIDEQSAQIPGRNLDIYAVDLQRVEILEGPQGVTFGSGAEGGVVRYITNKPELNTFNATIDGGVAGGVHSAVSGNFDATVNIPLIEDKLAARVVVYDDHRGGYIDSVPGTFVRSAADKGIHYAGYTNNIPGPPTATNSAKSIVADDINPTDYQGIRGELYYKFDQDWNVLLTESYQHLATDGVFYDTPVVPGIPNDLPGQKETTLPSLSVNEYTPSYNRDDFENTALTINGRIGDLNIVYSGAYLVRDVDTVQDYTAYARGIYADYYQCLPPNAKTGQKAQCYSPVTTWHNKEHDIHDSQELRLSTPDDWRLRAIGGLYWEQFEVDATTDYEYKTAPGFTLVGPAPGADVNNPNIRDANDAFFNDIKRGYTQDAAYVSLDYDLLKDPEWGTVTISAGTRFYRFDNFERGAVTGSFGCAPGDGTGVAPCLASAVNLDHENLNSEYHGFTNRFNLTWKINPDAMVYYTYSEGFRPGGFNRESTKSGPFPDFSSPLSYAPDTLINNEIGWKTQWFNHHLLFDGAVYQEEWDNVQVSLFDPGQLGNLTFGTNGPDFRVRGIEGQLTARPMQGLTISGSAAFNKSDQLNSPFLVSQTGLILTQVANPFGDPGSPLAQSPIFKGNLRVRYDFDMGDFYPFVQASANYSGHTQSAVAFVNDYEESHIFSLNASVGVSKDNWSVQAYVDNLTNQHDSEFTSSAEWVKAYIVDRPLTAGVKFTYKFGK